MRGYIDGFNLYHGLKARGWSRYRWLDQHKLVEQLVLPAQILEGVKYFTSLMTHQSALR